MPSLDIRQRAIALLDQLPQNKLAALFNPRQQSWHEHFSLSEDATQMVGQTPCGRATLEALSLNRPGVINLRRLLALAGLHPPT